MQDLDEMAKAIRVSMGPVVSWDTSSLKRRVELCYEEAAAMLLEGSRRRGEPETGDNALRENHLHRRIVDLTSEAQDLRRELAETKAAYAREQKYLRLCHRLREVALAYRSVDCLTAYPIPNARELFDELDANPLPEVKP